jgi:hypothetical protein
MAFRLRAVLFFYLRLIAVLPTFAALVRRTENGTGQRGVGSIDDILESRYRVLRMVSFDILHLAVSNTHRTCSDAA